MPGAVPQGNLRMGDQLPKNAEKTLEELEVTVLEEVEGLEAKNGYWPVCSQYKPLQKVIQ